MLRWLWIGFCFFLQTANAVEGDRASLPEPAPMLQLPPTPQSPHDELNACRNQSRDPAAAVTHDIQQLIEFIDPAFESAKIECERMGELLSRTEHEPLNSNLKHVILNDGPESKFKIFTEGGFKKLYSTNDRKRVISEQVVTVRNKALLENVFNEVQIQHDLSKIHGVNVLKPLGLACFVDKKKFYVRTLYPRMRRDLIDYYGDNVHHDSYYSSVKRIAGQLCQTLHTAHEAGIFHRDIKEENVLLDENGNAYFADFGEALRATDSQLEKRKFAGDERYLFNSAKRDWRTSKREDRVKLMNRDDKFAFGTLLMALMMGGAPPWNDESLEHHEDEKIVDIYLEYLQQHLAENSPNLSHSHPHALSPDQNLVFELIRVSLKGTEHPSFIEECNKLRVGGGAH